MRDIVFVSHASPEDNEFARWLTLQLVKGGYRAWCDLTKLLGGEDFWADAEAAIRTRTAKHLYVLSRTSNRKEGVLSELSVARSVAKDHGIKDFVIPLLIDDLPYQDFNIEISRLEAISFNDGWAPGLSQLLRKLERDRVPKAPTYTPAAVADWWRTQFDANQGVQDVPEEYLSNWFPVSELPDEVHFHTLSWQGTGTNRFLSRLPYPAVRHRQYAVSFATARDLAVAGSRGIARTEAHSLATEDMLAGRPHPRALGSGDGRKLIVWLLRMAWERTVAARGMRVRRLAGGRRFACFPKGMLEKDSIPFVLPDGRRTSRAMVGFRTMERHTDGEDTRRYWHFGIQANPILEPEPAYVVTPHLAFSRDGSDLWSQSKTVVHRARRSQARNWRNLDWRDRILAMMAFLAAGDQGMVVRLGHEQSACVSCSPVRFSSPVTYVEPDAKTAPISPDEDVAPEFDEEDAD